MPGEYHPSDLPRAEPLATIPANNSLADTMTKIYHNPRCSKSRAAHELLESRKLDFDTVKYLDTPPSAEQLADIIAMLGISPQALVRKGEALYKELALDESALSDADWIQLLADHPKLIERPIVVHNGKAAIGRPIDNIINILG